MIRGTSSYTVRASGRMMAWPAPLTRYVDPGTASASRRTTGDSHTSFSNTRVVADSSMSRDSNGRGSLFEYENPSYQKSMMSVINPRSSATCGFWRTTSKVRPLKSVMYPRESLPLLIATGVVSE